MTPIKKLIEDLDYWIYIGTGDDIVKCPSNRPEYQHLVKHLKSEGIQDDEIPREALLILREEIQFPFFLRSTFWHLLKLSFSNWIRRLA